MKKFLLAIAVLAFAESAQADDRLVERLISTVERLESRIARLEERNSRQERHFDEDEESDSDSEELMSFRARHLGYSWYPAYQPVRYMPASYQRSNYQPTYSNYQPSFGMRSNEGMFMYGGQVVRFYIVQ